MRRLLAATLVLLTLFLPFQVQAQTPAAKGPAAKTQAERYAIAKELVSRQDGFLAPTQVFKLMADPFGRAFFMDIRLGPDWGPDHPQWASHYPAFRAEVLELLLPLGTSLEDYLASTLAQSLLSFELERLRDRLADRGIARAVQRLQEEGLPWQNILLFMLMQQLPAYYSATEKEQVAHLLQKGFRRARNASQERALDRDIAPLAAFIESPQYQQYFRAMSDAFQDRALQVGKNYPQAFPKLVQRWRARLGREGLPRPGP